MHLIEFLHFFEITDRKVEHQSRRQKCCTASVTEKPNRIVLHAHIKLFGRLIKKRTTRIQDTSIVFNFPLLMQANLDQRFDGKLLM